MLSEEISLGAIDVLWNGVTNIKDLSPYKKVIVITFLTSVFINILRTVNDITFLTFIIDKYVVIFTFQTELFINIFLSIILLTILNVIVLALFIGQDIS